MDQLQVVFGYGNSHALRMTVQHLSGLVDDHKASSEKDENAPLKLHITTKRAI